MNIRPTDAFGFSLGLGCKKRSFYGVHYLNIFLLFYGQQQLLVHLGLKVS